MLFFQLHALLFLISSTPVFATPIPVPPEGPSQALVPPYRGIKFTIPEELHRITLYRVPGSDSDPRLADDVLELVKEPNENEQSVRLTKLSYDQPHTFSWSLRPVKFNVDDQVARIKGRWLAFPTFDSDNSGHINFECRILVNIQFEQNHVEAKVINFEPRIVGDLKEVSRLSDIKGYWYPPTAQFLGVKVPPASPGSIVRVVDDEKITEWKIDVEAGFLQPNARVVTLPASLDHFSGCWIRYPLKNLDINQRKEVVCIMFRDKRWKAFRGTWEVDTRELDR